MKRLLPILSFAVLLVTSCRKEYHVQKNDDFFSNVKYGLQQTMSTDMYSSLDLSKLAKTVIRDSIVLVRVGFKNKMIQKEFVLLKTSATGAVQFGQIVRINGEISAIHEFEGSITIADLTDAHPKVSKISGGHIQRRSTVIASNINSVDAPPPSMGDPYLMLPEVVIVSTIPSSGGAYSFPLYSLSSFLPNWDAGGGSGGWYSSSDPFGGGGGTGGSGVGNLPNNDPVLNDEAVYINYETQFNDAAIDVNQYLKCFDNMPDNSFTMASIQISTDIPVNGDPTKFFRWSNQSPGHTFITLTKSNGGETITQHIGFYPATGWKATATTGPMRGKFVDNGFHEVDASLSIPVTPNQLREAIIRIQQLARSARYDIDEYNCTDWAIDIFNHTVAPEQQLEIPRFDIPGCPAPFGSNTPQGLYMTLDAMKQAGGQQALGVNVTPTGSAASSSHGPCN